MNRRNFLARATAIGAATALPIQRFLQPAVDKAADAARLLGFRVTDAPSGGPAAMNIWRALSDTESVMVGWIYRDGSTVWQGIGFADQHSAEGK